MLMTKILKSGTADIHAGPSTSMKSGAAVQRGRSSHRDLAQHDRPWGEVAEK